MASEKNIDGKYDFVTASEEWKSHCSYDMDCEAIVYAVQASGTLGRSHYVNGKFVASNQCLVLTPKFDSEYPINVCFYSIYLNSIRKQIVRELSDGTSKLTISKRDLLNFHIEYFPIDIQNEIVRSYDDVAKRQKELDEAKQNLCNIQSCKTKIDNSVIIYLLTLKSAKKHAIILKGC